MTAKRDKRHEKRVYRDNAEKQKAYRLRHIKPEWHWCLKRLLCSDVVFEHMAVWRALAARGLVEPVQYFDYQIVKRSPYALTERGAALAAELMRQERVVQNVKVWRTSVRDAAVPSRPKKSARKSEGSSRARSGA